MVAVWAYCLVGALVLGLRLALALAIVDVGLVFTATALRGEVDATLRVETGDVRWIGNEEMLCDSRIPAVMCQCCFRGVWKQDLLFEESLRHDLLQSRVVEHHLALREHARQVSFCELASCHPCLGLLLDALVADALEVFASVYEAGSLEATLRVLGGCTNSTLGSRWPRLRFLWWWSGFGHLRAARLCIRRAL